MNLLPDRSFRDLPSLHLNPFPLNHQFKKKKKKKKQDSITMINGIMRANHKYFLPAAATLWRNTGLRISMLTL